MKSPRVRGPGPWRIEWSNDKISDWLIRFSFSSLLMSQEKIKSVKIENIEFYDAVWSVLFKYTVYWSRKWVTKLILSGLRIIPLWLILRGELNPHLRISRQSVVILGFCGHILKYLTIRMSSLMKMHRMRYHLNQMKSKIGLKDHKYLPSRNLNS